MNRLDQLLKEACEVRCAAELQAFNTLAADNFQRPLFLREPPKTKKGRKVAVVLLAACLLFATAVCAVWPTVSVKILQGKAYLLTEDTETGNTAFRQFTVSSLPAECELIWNRTEGYYSCTVQKGPEKFTVVQYPLDHRAQIIGDNREGPATQNDLEGIREDFCLVSNVEELTDAMLETHTVISWATDNSYFVTLNDNWTDFPLMREILQGIRN